jgi:hypothetical protein
LNRIDSSTVNKQQWIKNFLNTGGFNEILKQFHYALNLFNGSGKTADNMDNTEKSFVEYMLRLIKTFITASFKAMNKSQTSNPTNFDNLDSLVDHETAEIEREQ